MRAGGTWLEADIDVQNAERPNAYVGFWDKMGRYFIAADRTKEIFQKRRMACDGLALILSGADGALKPNIFCGRYTDGGHKI